MAAWEKQREHLLSLRAGVENRLQRSGQYGLDDSMQDELGELSLYDNHPADIGDELFERGKDLALRDADKIRLQEIDRALTAIEDGTYGTCTGCGQPIPPERLEAYPMTTQCIACKRRDEARHPDRDRPVEESFLWPGYGRTNLDGADSTAFDGEDAWQAVARFNERPHYEHDTEVGDLDDNEGIVDEADQVTNEVSREQW